MYVRKVKITDSVDVSAICLATNRGGQLLIGEHDRQYGLVTVEASALELYYQWKERRLPKGWIETETPEK